MAANKFATMLHRNTNKLTLILIYAVLEWVLIILLLLNSVFSYLIIKFADYFGLKSPCLWCSRVDHIIDPLKSKNPHRDLLCEVHSTEISKLGYCSNHRKLCESRDMCEDCSSSHPNTPEESKNLDLFPWAKDENGEVTLKCSCCGVILEREVFSPRVVIKPSWGDLDHTQKENLIAEEGDDHRIEELDDSDQKRSDISIENRQDEDKVEVGCSVSLSNSGVRELKFDEPIKEENPNLIMEDPSSCEPTEDVSIEILPQHLEFFVGQGGFRLIPVELIDSATEENQSKYRIQEEEDENCDNFEVNMGFEAVERESLGEREADFSGYEVKEEAKFAVIESMEIEENENSLVFYAKECDLVKEVYEHVEEILAAAEEEEIETDFPAVTEEGFQVPVNETEADVSIGTEIPDLETTDDFQNQENFPTYRCINEDSSTNLANFNPEDDHGSGQVEDESIELRTTISVEVRETVTNKQASQGLENEMEEERVPDTPTSIENLHNLHKKRDTATNNQYSQGLENEMEEERIPDTPTSIENLHNLHKKLLILEKKESGTEESLDGSVISEFEGGEGVLTIEHLKSALRAERKALNALYSELEEERSASAVAANQTMAMINRLQEEKAAMQMEALQYQRMMDEQSEYDQEALELLNELMVKREREKEEVERELEVYRKKVCEYEAKEKMRVLRKSGSSFASSSNSGDSDGLSIDLNQEAKEEDGLEQENTPVEAVLNLEESLANFEEERLSILDQLKVLEENLFRFDDGEGGNFEDFKSIEHFYKENGIHLDGNSNGFPKEMNGKHHQEGRITKGGKRLLPLFDVVSEENEGKVENGHVNGFDCESNEMENKKVAIEEEVDHLYERLQALEADREFLKHCICSLKKGEKGMDLLQEILQHLRDLRDVDLCVRNLSGV